MTGIFWTRKYHADLGPVIRQSGIDLGRSFDGRSGWTWKTLSGLTLIAYEFRGSIIVPCGSGEIICGSIEDAELVLIDFAVGRSNQIH